MAIDSKEIDISDGNGHTLVLGGGLSGLSAGFVLSKEGLKVTVLEAGPTVGGLSRTMAKGDFLFDLGGHRFHTIKKEIDKFVKDLMADELITVQRKSKIYFRGKYFDYPLKPLNSMFGLGLFTTIRIIFDYAKERIASLVRKKEVISLEDWVVGKFGRTMFNIYFKDYSEKVWGIDCSRIGQDWVAKRISGLSLATAIKHAFFSRNNQDLHTLANTFVYPKKGIGRISDRLKEEIQKSNQVLTDTSVVGIEHADGRIKVATIKTSDGLQSVSADNYVSSIPITTFIRMLEPKPPADVLEATDNLKFRDLLVVAAIVDRPQVTDQTWIYIQDKSLPTGRIHEPKNWSPHMAPKEQTLLVVEFFCFKGDSVWSAEDKALVDTTAECLHKLGFIEKHELIDAAVVRVPKAYPLFEVGYIEHTDKVLGYLSGFKNLHIIGRSGEFKYHNMDYAIETGIEAAKRIIAGTPAPQKEDPAAMQQSLKDS